VRSSIPTGGAFSIGVEGGALGVQRYLPNTNVLTTTFTTRDGSFRVLDFAPRFIQNERSFRPTKLLRIVEPLSGTPRVVVRCDPRLGWSKERPQKDTGSHHVSYLGYPTEVRLTTDIPISYLDGESFALTATKHFVFSWGAPVEEALAPLCQRFLSETTRYWQRWVKACAVPLLHQEEVIRSALALKLHCFEDTGAIVAALTTSLPEAPGSGRTGTTATAGSAMRTTRSRRSACSVASRSASSSSSSSSTSRPLRGPRARPSLSGRWKKRSRGAHLAELAGLRGARTGAGGQRGRAAQAARRLRGDGAGADADVPRCAFRRSHHAPGARAGDRLGPQGHRGGGATGRGDLGVPHGVATSDVQLAHVLGSDRPHGAHRPSPSSRPRGRVPGCGRPHRARGDRQGGGRGPEHLGGRLRGHRGGCCAPSGRDARPPRAWRRPRPRHHRRGARRSGVRRLAPALPHRRRIRTTRGGLCALHLLVHRGPGPHGAARRCARHAGPSPRQRERAPGPLGGGRPRREPPHVGEFSPGVLARGVDPRSVRSPCPSRARGS
jgi:hypothetical protein